MDAVLKSGKGLLEAFKTGTDRTVPNIAAAPDAKTAEKLGIFQVFGAAGGTKTLFEAGENARAAIGEGSGAFDAHSAFFNGQFDEPLQAGKECHVIAGLFRDEKTDDVANTLLVERAVGSQAGAEIPLGLLACLTINFHRWK